MRSLTYFVDKLKKFNIQPISSSDISAISLVHKLCFIETYVGILDLNFLIEHKVSEIEKYWIKKISDKTVESYKFIFNDRIIGFISMGASRNPNFGGYEIYNFYIIKEFQNFGFGSYAFNQLMKNKTNFYVEVIARNRVGCKFYEKQHGKKLTRFYERYGERKIMNQVYVWK